MSMLIKFAFFFFFFCTTGYYSQWLKRDQYDIDELSHSPWADLHQWDREAGKEDCAEEEGLPAPHVGERAYEWRTQKREYALERKQKQKLDLEHDLLLLITTLLDAGGPSHLTGFKNKKQNNDNKKNLRHWLPEEGKNPTVTTQMKLRGDKTHIYYLSTTCQSLLATSKSLSQTKAKWAMDRWAMERKRLTMNRVMSIWVIIIFPLFLYLIFIIILKLPYILYK